MAQLVRAELIRCTFEIARQVFARLDVSAYSILRVIPTLEFLEQLRNSFSDLSGKLHAKGPGDVKSAVDWIVTAISSCLSIYQADYTRFMNGPAYSDLAPAHKERNWLALGATARDLLELRSYMAKAIKNGKCIRGFREHSRVGSA